MGNGVIFRLIQFELGSENNPPFPMKKTAVVFFSLAMAPLALATAVTAGPSNENLVFTGLGPNSAGNGQATMTLGTCAYDGSFTNCTLTGAYTGLGGGTFSIALKYQGNGPSPILATITGGSENTVALSLSSGSLITTLTRTDGTVTNFYYTFIYFAGTAAQSCTKATVCNTASVFGTAGATLTEKFIGTIDPTPSIRASAGVISAGQYGGFSAIAPGTWMEIYGLNLGTVLSQTWSGNDFKGDAAPTSLAGTTVTVGGKPAYVDFVSPAQVNAQVPSGLASGPQPVIVTTAGGSSAATTVTVNTVEPGILAPTAFQLSSGNYVAALFPDGSTFVLPPGTTNAVRTARAKPGDTVILYGVGFGSVTPDLPAGQISRLTNSLQMPFQVSFNGVPATVTFSGEVYGYVGLYQFNVVVPNVGSGDAVPLTFTLGGTKIPQNLVISIGS